VGGPVGATVGAIAGGVAGYVVGNYLVSDNPGSSNQGGGYVSNQGGHGSYYAYSGGRDPFTGEGIGFKI
jgi:hypothetical protein